MLRWQKNRDGESRVSERKEAKHRERMLVTETNGEKR
jgi:hypothetical protein